MIIRICCFALVTFVTAASALAQRLPADSIEVIALKTGTAFRFKGLAIDPMTSTAYLGSWDKKQLVVASLDGSSHGVIKTKYSGKLNGMGCYLRGVYCMQS
jgi:hypothetical protein